MSFGFAPKGWALCNGQLLPINQNQALFSVLGTYYGGNGISTFSLPNLQGKVPVHMGDGYNIGQSGGETAHSLTVAELPSHNHVVQGTSTNGAVPAPTATAVLGAVNNSYGAAANLTTLLPAAIANTGGSQPHVNMQPYLALTFCIALSGIFPSRN